MMKLASPLVPLLLTSAAALGCGDPLPTVDLGYAVHQPTFNDTGAYYQFANIRYADPPEPFHKAVHPTGINKTVNDGKEARICPQAYAQWELELLAPGYGLTPDELEEQFLTDPRISLDCLLLDVYVPKSIWDNKADTARNGSGAVLFWIHGGAYVQGAKPTSHNPAGLLSRSKLHDEEGIVFVGINYRLGLFGFLAGNDIVPNLGFWDQKLALEWVQKYIHLFGGDKTKVTVMGGSAGAGSGLYQITAFGGQQGPVPFRQAILMSPATAFAPRIKGAYDETVGAASYILGTHITTTQQLSALNGSTLMQINEAVVRAAQFADHIYAPGVDGDFVPDLPGRLLSQGLFDKSVEVIISHTANESTYFVPSSVAPGQLESWFDEVTEGVSASGRSFILDTLYPDDLSGEEGYTTEVGRMGALVVDSSIGCNVRFVASALPANTYSYIFAYPPAVHGQDTDYVFFNGETSTANASLAMAMQDYFVRFVIVGNPNVQGLPPWPIYGENITRLVFGDGTDGDLVYDGNANVRCQYWQTGAWRE